MVISTQDGAVYSLEMRAVGANGRMLTICRSGGVDDPPHTNAPMAEGRWYHVNVLTPLPPEAGASMDMILDPIADDATPVVRQTGPVMSVVGLIEPKGVVHESADDGSASIDDAIAGAGPRGRVVYSTGPTREAFLDGRGKAGKAGGLFAAVMGLAVLLGRGRR